VIVHINPAGETRYYARGLCNREVSCVLCYWGLFSKRHPCMFCWAWLVTATDLRIRILHRFLLRILHFTSVTFKMSTKNNIISFFILLLKVDLHHSSKIKSHKEVMKQSKSSLPYNFCLMMDISGSGTLTKVSGSGSPNTYGSGSGTLLLIMVLMKNCCFSSPRRRLRFRSASRREMMPLESRRPPTLGHCFFPLILSL
jgi:hypothetical protein